VAARFNPGKPRRRMSTGLPLFGPRPPDRRSAPAKPLLERRRRWRDAMLERMVHPVEEALQRADAMVENGQSSRAIASLEMMLFRFPEDARLVVRLAELYGEDGRRET